MEAMVGIITEVEEIMAMVEAKEEELSIWEHTPQHIGVLCQWKVRERLQKVENDQLTNKRKLKGKVPKVHMQGLIYPRL